MCHLNPLEPPITPILSCSFVFPAKSLALQRLLLSQNQRDVGQLYESRPPEDSLQHIGFAEILIKQGSIERSPWSSVPMRRFVKAWGESCHPKTFYRDFIFMGLPPFSFLLGVLALSRCC